MDHDGATVEIYNKKKKSVQIFMKFLRDDMDHPVS